MGEAGVYQEATVDERSRDRILRASAALFRDKGYAGVSMRLIAEASGMTAGSLYHHFPSKEQIVAEVLELGIARVHDAVARSLHESAEVPPEERLRRAIHAHLDALLAHSDFTSANVRIFGQLTADLQARNLAVRRRYQALWDAFLSELQRDGVLRQGIDVKSVRQLWIGALNATLEWFDAERGPLAALAEGYSDLFLHGVLAKGRPQA